MRQDDEQRWTTGGVDLLLSRERNEGPGRESRALGVLPQGGFEPVVLGSLDAVPTGAVLATVTSADGGFAPGASDLFRRVQISPLVSPYENNERRYVWLVNDGNAANFLHGAVIGPAIQLVRERSSLR